MAIRTTEPKRHDPLASQLRLLIQEMRKASELTALLSQQNAELIDLLCAENEQLDDEAMPSQYMDGSPVN